MILLLFLPQLFSLVAAAQNDPVPKQFTKHYHVYDLPHAKWDESDKNINSYKHEIVLQGGLVLPCRRGSNYSVYPTRACGNKRISFVVQLDPPEGITDNEKRQSETCTVSITIDDGHVEVWFGLCVTRESQHQRKFNFPLNPMSVVYFTFKELTMIVYKRDSDDGQDFEMGRIEHYSVEKDFKEFTQFLAFTYMDSCKFVDLKMVFDENDWRNSPEEATKKDYVSVSELQWRMLAIFMSVQSITALILSTMYVWSQRVPFCTNWIYDSLLAKNTKDGTVHHSQEAEAHSCKTAEDVSEQEEEGKEKKEDLFGDKGKNKPPKRAPPGYALPEYDSPYADDGEDELDALNTAIDLE